jgi:ribose transport system substrate-binding protein
MEKYEMNKISRRAFLRHTALATGVTIVAGTGMVSRLALAQDKLTVVNSIRSLKNPYHGTWNLGGRIFAESIGADYVTLLTEGDSQKGLGDINALLARTNGNMCLNVDPNQSPDATPIVRACVDAGAFVVTQWNKPDDLHPWDFNPNYVAHISFAGVPYGQATAEALFAAMGGSGGIVALGGLAANVPAIERKQGLDNALAANSNVELLDFQVAEWDTGKALDITNTWLTRFGDEIKGIWAANDSMGFGALSALQAAGLDGQIPVTGIDGTSQAVQNVLDGTFAATVAWDPFWQGGMGLSLAYHAKTGTFDPAAEPEEHREFYGTGLLISSDNAEEYYNLNVLDVPRVDWTDLWGRVTGQIQYATPEASS